MLCSFDAMEGVGRLEGGLPGGGDDGRSHLDVLAHRDEEKEKDDRGRRISYVCHGPIGLHARTKKSINQKPGAVSDFS